MYFATVGFQTQWEGALHRNEPEDLPETTSPTGLRVESAME